MILTTPRAFPPRPHILAQGRHIKNRLDGPKTTPLRTKHTKFQASIINYRFLSDAIGARDSTNYMLSVFHRRTRFWGQKCPKMPGSPPAMALNEHNLVFFPFFSNWELPQH